MAGITSPAQGSSLPGRHRGDGKLIGAAAPSTRETQMPPPAEIKALRWQEKASPPHQATAQISIFPFWRFPLLQHPPSAQHRGCLWAAAASSPNFLGLPGSRGVITKHLLSLSYVMAIAMETG